MATIEKAKVFMNGRSQAVRIPAAFRFNTDEVYIRRDPQNGDLILSKTPGEWADVYADLDRAGIPESFLSNRKQGKPQKRKSL